MAHFKKIMLSTPLHLTNGKKLAWTALAGNMGVVETDDTELVAQLQAAISKNIGGVSVINEKEFDELKKNPANKLKKPQWQPGIMPSEINPFHSSPKSSKSSDAVGDNPSVPPERVKHATSPKTSKPEVRSGVLKKSSNAR